MKWNKYILGYAAKYYITDNVMHLKLYAYSILLDIYCFLTFPEMRLRSIKTLNSF